MAREREAVERMCTLERARRRRERESRAQRPETQVNESSANMEKEGVKLAAEAPKQRDEGRELLHAEMARIIHHVAALFNVET
ncbi:hypothetical protein LTR85_002262 [Meristemomyces frigidus]|nr:hypothetical protein LTR85_002262 [Meristemomyces frigidus]